MPQQQHQPVQRERGAVPTENTDFVTVSNRAAVLRRQLTKLRLKGGQVKKPFFITSAFVNVILFIALVAVLVIWIMDMKDPPIAICTSRECLESGYRIANAIDKEVNPCDDFYDFACGNWHITHKATDNVQHTSVFKEAEKELRKSVLELLKKSEDLNDPLPVIMAKGLHKECMRTELIELLKLYTLKNVLEKCGLPREIPNENTSVNFNLTETLSKIHYHIPITDALFELGITVHPQEESKKLLLVSYPKKQRPYKFPSFIGPDPESQLRRKKRSPSEFVRDEVKYRAMVMSLFEDEKKNGTKLSVSELNTAALKIIILESEFARFIPKRPLCKLVTIEELQKTTDKGTRGKKNPMKIEWKTFLENMFKNVKRKTIGVKYELVTDSLDYFGRIGSKISKEKPESIQRLIWWNVVDFLAVYSMKAMREMRSINYGETDHEGIQRSMECMKIIEKVIPLAITYKLMTQPLMETNKIKVQQMLSDIKESLATIIEDAEWMDKNTSQPALEKLDNMNFTIGYPEEYIEQDYLNSLYTENALERGNFLESVVNLYTAEAKRALTVLDEPTDGKEIAMSELRPLENNAYHIFTSNSIIILPGLLQVPFYGMGLEVINYAAIGSILGHEIMHGFDNTGKMFDKDGNLNNWWSKDTSKEFLQRTKCFVEQYNNYNYFQKNMRGSLTLGENIADNYGVRQSYMAYQMYKNREGPEPRLPGLEEYTDEQLFFISFAHTFCSNHTPEMTNTVLKNDHSPDKYRVIGTLSNMEEFSGAWNCPKGSTMNPEKKCIVW